MKVAPSGNEIRSSSGHVRSADRPGEAHVGAAADRHHHRLRQVSRGDGGRHRGEAEVGLHAISEPPKMADRQRNVADRDQRPR